jgi:hypothetical protein
MITPIGTPQERNMVAQDARRGVRIKWQQQHAFHAIGHRHVRVVDAGIGHYKTEPMLDNQQARAVADNPLRLAEHNFDKARILAELGGERYGALRWLDTRDFNIATFSL